MIVVARKKKYIGIAFTIGMLISLFMIFVCFVNRIFILLIIFIIILLMSLYLSMDYSYTPNEIIKYDERTKSIVFKNGSIKIDEMDEINAKRTKDIRGFHFHFGNLYIESNNVKYRFKYISNVGKVRGDLIYLKHNNELPKED
jgi:hypothetical protein